MQTMTLGWPSTTIRQEAHLPTAQKKPRGRPVFSVCRNRRTPFAASAAAMVSPRRPVIGLPSNEKPTGPRSSNASMGCCPIRRPEALSFGLEVLARILYSVTEYSDAVRLVNLFPVRHQAEDAAGRVADAGDVILGPVGVVREGRRVAAQGGVAEADLPVLA